MTETPSWRDALMRLHLAGWDTDDIDAACEAVEEAAGSGVSIGELSSAEVRDALESEVRDDEVSALLTIADLRARQGAEAQSLRDALYDLDAFAYEYAGDD